MLIKRPYRRNQMIYITGDIHGAFDIHKINPDEFTVGNSLTKDDYVVIAGDFGCIWDGGSSDRFWLNWLETLPWTTVFIDGNHENFDVLNAYPEEDWHGGRIHRIRSNIVHLMRGEIFDLDGKKWFVFGGGFSHDRTMRTEGKNWWKAELPTREECARARKNLEACGWKVDYILTHDVYTAHPLADKYSPTMDGYGTDQENIQEFLEEVRKKTEYDSWFCAHYHTDGLCLTDGKPCFTLYDYVTRLEDFTTTPVYLFKK